MSATLINLIIQLVFGAIGGNAAASAAKDYDLGKLGNTIAGAIGGVGGGQILQALIPMLAGTAGGGADIAVMAGVVANRAADEGTLEAALGGSGRCG